jgi:hypothetical protein
MAIILNDNIQNNAPKPTDSRYSNNLTSWVDVAEANANINSAVRYIGLTVNIASVEYRYKNGITDSDLIEKSASETIEELTANKLVYIDPTLGDDIL